MFRVQLQHSFFVGGGTRRRTMPERTMKAYDLLVGPVAPDGRKRAGFCKRPEDRRESQLLGIEMKELRG